MGSRTDVHLYGDGIPAGPLDGLDRIPWEGADYWSQFAKADASGWSDPSFFPISVFLSDPNHADELKALGINTYMGIFANEGAVTTATAAGMFVLPQQTEWTSAEVGNNQGAVGWMISDECEMGYSGCDINDVEPDDGDNKYRRLAVQQGYIATVAAYDDGRFTHANYGNGILETWWASGIMDQWVPLTDSASADKYTYTSPHVWGITEASPSWPDGATVATAASYGWQADQMRKFQDPDSLNQIWTFVETARPYLTEDGALTITPAQMEGAVWSAIIHEARGIAYFQHNNDTGYAGNMSLVDDAPAALTDKITAVNAKVGSLAPVLNTQSYVFDFGASGIDTALKLYDGDVYIVAGVGLGGTTGSKTFTVPDTLPAGATVEVVDESRTVSMTGHQFSDSFTYEYTHHVYRIPV